MTALETLRRQNQRKSANWGARREKLLKRSNLCRHPPGNLAQRFVASRNRSHSTTTPIEIDATTLAVIQFAVNDLLETSAPVTVLSLANALVGDANVLDVHAQANAANDLLVLQQQQEEEPEPTFRGFWPRPRRRRRTKTDPQVQRKYELMHALHQLEQRAGAALDEIASWEDARNVLETVLVLPEDADETSNTAPNENDNDNNDDDLLDFQKRLQQIKLSSSKTIGLRPSQHHWQQILANKQSSSLLRSVEELQREKEKLLQQEIRPEPPEWKQIREQQLAQERAAEARARAAALLRPLTDDELDRIHDAWSHGDDEDVLAQTDQDVCLRKSLRTLQPGTWLNDEAIHYFLVTLSGRDEGLCRSSKDGRKRCHFFKSFFMTKLRNEYDAQNLGEYSYKNVKRWSKKVPGA